MDKNRPPGTNDLAVSILNALPLATMLFDKQKRLVFANNALLKFLDITSTDKLLGLLPGELLGCKKLLSSTTDCGSSPSCRVCSLFKAIEECLINGLSSAEGTMNLKNGSINIAITSEIITIDNKEFVLLSLEDISNEKKQKLLERIFYHDILNTAQNIHGMSQLLNSGEFEDEREKFTEMLHTSAVKLIEEINTHRLICLNEQFENTEKPGLINSFELYSEIASEFNAYLGEKGTFSLDAGSKDFSFISNKALIKRVITNMVKNAFEAEDGDSEITLGIAPASKNGAKIWVHNPGFMNEGVQLQVFNCSFSTKSSDRGLGTYSMKLLSEKYLKGKIYFTSNQETGTTFCVEIPGLT